ncbi:hypothetical protein [Allosphingosinicella sp.]|uniref:hypothetical protein n=1 Tax=Allosphingosinicella sp. TaxID=2823234 RepID=UPI003784F50F
MKKRLLPALALAAVATPAAAQPIRGAEFRAFLQERFAEDRTSYPDTRYVVAWADLNGDRRPEALVYLISGNACGTGGCTLYIYTPEQGSWYQHGSLTVTNPPIRVLNSRSHGWRDLAVRVSGGGARSHDAVVRHGRVTYESNPSLAPALGHRSSGRVVITESDRGRALF